MNGAGDPIDQRQKPSFFLGETPAETLRNIDSVLQVLADATQAPISSEATNHGHWLVIQELAAAARQAATRLDEEQQTAD